MIIPTDEERAAFEAAFALVTPTPSLDTRVAVVEADVADLDAIIVAVLS